MASAKFIGWTIVIVAVIAAIWLGSAYAEKNGYCILVCKWSEEIAKSRAEADAATERADDLEDRAETAERNNKGIPPWVGFLSLLLLALVFLWNETSNESSGNITEREGRERCADYMRDVWGVVPIQEDFEHGYLRIWTMSGQVVPGSKDSWFYVYGFVFNWPPGMSYPPGQYCTTMWMLSTDPDRAIGVVPGMNTQEVYSVIMNARVQKTPTPTDIAQALDRALTEKKLSDTLVDLNPGGAE